MSASQLIPEVVAHRPSALLRHRVRAAAHRIISDCELLLSATAEPEWRLWHEPIGEALLAGHQLRSAIERRFHAGTSALSPDELAALTAELQEPQRRIVQAMTSLMAIVPTDVADELLLGDVRAIRDVALRLGGDETSMMPAAPDGLARDSVWPRPSLGGGTATEATIQTARLLVVDDSEAQRSMVVRLLEKLGYDVVDAADGLGAMAIAERERIDVILSDIEMPVCDGFELLRRLKANDATRDIPVIVVSGFGDVADVVRCIELGAEDHLSKPFDGLLLQARVRASLERKRLRDQEVDYLRRVAQLTLAAEEVETSTYQHGSLAHIADRDDALGRLARVFDRVVSGLQAREAKLRRRIRAFKDEIHYAKGRPSLSLLSLSDAQTLAVGFVLAGRYGILDKLGSGGMGVVYRALDHELGEEVAIKVMHAERLRTDPSLIERLKMETRLARRITHPNVVRAHDFGEWQGMYFLTMEYVKGITVESLIEMQGRLSAASALAIGTQLAEALVVAHAQQIIHRDIKPANLLVDDEGVLKVTDFGLARPIENERPLTGHGSVVGTPMYMAPEQLFGGKIDERSDLFAAGVILYECLSGLPPFDATTPTAIFARMLEGPPAPVDSLAPEVTPGLAAIVHALLQYEPPDRLQSARELAERLREVG
jgi:CheY-like chemotaxis protein